MGRKRLPPSEEPVAAPRDGEPIVDIEFDRKAALAMARKDNISEARWERIQRDVDIRDILEYLYPDKRMVSNKIRCPFHGSDRTPSFTIYPRTNSAFCFGCPDKDGFWDSVKIVSRSLEISIRKAVRWIEDEWNLEPMDDDDHEDEATEEIVVLTAEDLAAPFIAFVRDFTITHKRDAAETCNDVDEAANRFYYGHHQKDALPLARLLGSQRVKALRSAKIEAATQ
jgi:hypothetical protein